MVTHLVKCHSNLSPARTISDMTLLLALSLDCRLFIQRSPMGEHGYDYLHSGASVLRVNVNMVVVFFVFWRKDERRLLRNFSWGIHPAAFLGSKLGIWKCVNSLHENSTTNHTELLLRGLSVHGIKVYFRYSNWHHSNKHSVLVELYTTSVDGGSRTVDPEGFYPSSVLEAV
jgi:hypothetical protein